MKLQVIVENNIENFKSTKSIFDIDATGLNNHINKNSINNNKNMTKNYNIQNRNLQLKKFLRTNTEDTDSCNLEFLSPTKLTLENKKTIKTNLLGGHSLISS